VSLSQNQSNIRVLFFSWPIANLFGFGLGILSLIFSILLSGGWGLPHPNFVDNVGILKIQPHLKTFLFGAIFGLLLGFAQMVAIDEFLEKAWLWVISTVIGYGVGFLVADFALIAFPLVFLTVSSFLSSTLQWFIFRQQMVSQKAVYWISANLGLGIFVGLVVIFIPLSPFLTISAWTFGSIFVGILLARLIGRRDDAVGAGEIS
jgi:hypothetical protein